jgi:integrase
VRGELEQRGVSTWRIRVFAGRDDGRPRYVSRTVHGSKRVAEKELNRLLADVEGGKIAKSHQGSVADLLDRWLDDITPTRSAYTIREHRRTVERDIKPVLGAIPLDKLTSRELDGLYRELLSRGLSASSVRRHHSILSAALRRAVRWGVITNNPAGRASPPGLTRSTVTAPAVEDVQKLVAAATEADPVLAAAIALGAVSGARRGELCALRWSDVDWKRRTLKIARSLTVLHREPSEGQTKTHQRRDIAVDEALGAFLRYRRAAQEEYAALVGTQLVVDPFILSRLADGSAPCLPDGLTAGYKRIATKLGLDSHFHELRHFAATTAIAAGSDVRTVAGRLGHADPSVTLRVYAHASEARDRELAGLLGRAVFNAEDGSRVGPRGPQR